MMLFGVSRPREERATVGVVNERASNRVSRRNSKSFRQLGSACLPVFAFWRRLGAPNKGTLKRVAAKRVVDYSRGKRWPRFAGKFRRRIETFEGARIMGSLARGI